MSNLEKILTYDSMPAKVGLVITSALLPLWGLMAPLALFIFSMMDIGCIFVHENFDELIRNLGYTFGAALCFFVGVIVTGILKDNIIRVSREGLTVPIFLAAHNNFETFVDFRDIDQLLVEGDDLNSPNIKLIFRMKSGGRITLDCKYLDQRDLEHLIVSTTLWCEPSCLNERVIELKDTLSSSDQHGLLSYTRMWEEELGNRYSATAFMPLNPGKRLLNEQLKIVRQLTFGGWSAVYLCQDSNTKLRVLKESVLPASVGKNLKEKAEAMFLKESILLMKLSHPNIVKVHEHFVEDDRHYMLLDYINGQNMRQLVKTMGPQHQLDVLDWAFVLADVLNYLHGQDPPLIHRDLTPDNVVVDSEGTLMLIDFGAANELLGTATGTLVGKQCYISPEQFRGKAQASSDLYSLGATLHFLLTGTDPEALSTSSPRKVVPYINEQFDQLIQDLTASDVVSRPQSAADVKERLTAVRRSMQLVADKNGKLIPALARAK